MRITISSLLFRNCLLDKVIARSEKAETHILSIHEKRFFLDELQRAAFICLGSFFMSVSRLPRSEERRLVLMETFFNVAP